MVICFSFHTHAVNVLAAERYFSASTGIFSPGSTRTFDANSQPLTTNYSTGWAVNGAIGVGLDNGLRLENELAYKTASSDAWALGWLINIWWDAKNSTPFTPYIGGGFGFGRGHAASPGIVDNDITGFAYQAGGGVAWKLQPQLSLDLGYRYFGIADASSSSIGVKDLAGSSLMISVRVGF